MLSADEALNQTVGELKGVQRGKVRIGAFNSVCVAWLPQLVTECRAKYPGVEIEIDQGTYDDVIELRPACLIWAFCLRNRRATLRFVRCIAIG